MQSSRPASFGFSAWGLGFRAAFDGGGGEYMSTTSDGQKAA